MSILGSKNYLIHAHFFEGDPSNREGATPYVGNFEELWRVIGTTWSKVPHQVNVKANQVHVTKEGSSEVLATFTFVELTELTDQRLPDHF